MPVFIGLLERFHLLHGFWKRLCLFLCSSLFGNCSELCKIRCLPLFYGSQHIVQHNMMSYCLFRPAEPTLYKDILYFSSHSSFYSNFVSDVLFSRK